MPQDASSRPGEVQGEGPPTVALLVDREANRDQLSTWLAADYEVVVPAGESPRTALSRCDLAIVDGDAFGRHRAAIAAAKAAADPLFLPVVLVVGDRDRLGADPWEAVDDVVDAPVRQAELRGRIDVLLRTRGYSRALLWRNQRLERFAGTVSHDLRNPLTVARGFLERLRETDDPDHLDRVDRALDRMQRIIDDLLALARSGTELDERSPVDLRAAAAAAWSHVESHGATLEIGIDGVTVTGDEGRLIELFENLFRNAVEHAGGDAAVRVGDLDGEGFFVEDDGPGVPAEDRESVFDYGVTSRPGGTGFGLAIVQGVCAAHGWTVDVTSGAEGGARFEVRTAPADGREA